MNLYSSLDFGKVIWDTQAHPEPPEIVLGGYRRASTHGQRQGWRFQETIEDLIQLALGMGPQYGVMLFDEGVRSGSSIAKRGEIAVLLEYLRTGLLHGIVTTDIKRLTRDWTLTDGLEIARVLQGGPGILVTKGRVWNLRDSRDYQDYRAELLSSAQEISVIRNVMFEGQEKRAQAIARGDAPPMFKGPAPVGYRSVVCYRPLDPTKKWETDPTQSNEPMIHRGVVIRTWIKCVDCGPHVEALHEELLRNTDAADVARAMNRRGIPAPWKLRDDTRYWTAKLVRQVLRHSIYWGRWKWVYNPSEDTDLWKSCDPTKYQADLLGLAYWTAEEAVQFEKVYLRPDRRLRSTKEHEHLAVGLIACSACHEVLGEAGRDYSVRQDGRVYSPTRLRCPKCGRFSSEDGLLRALDDYFHQVVVDRVGDLRARVERAVKRRRHNPMQACIDAIDRRLAALAIVALPGPARPHLQAEIKLLSNRREVLRGELNAAPPMIDSQRLVELCDSFAIDANCAYNSMSPREKSALWRIILRDDDGNLTPIEMVRVKKGNSQKSPGRWAVVKSPLT
jgi:hypothetical protein